MLSKCRALSILGLGENSIGDQGARRLPRVLSQCPVLPHLGLHGNHRIGVEGAGSALSQCRDNTVSSGGVARGLCFRGCLCWCATVDYWI